MALRFDDELHEYFDGAVQLSGVTTVIRYISREKGDKAPEQAREVARDRGQRVHEYCLFHDYGIMPDWVDGDCAPYVEAYKAFMRDYGITAWKFSEMLLGSAEMGYAGTIDRMGVIDGKKVIVDLKCVSVVDKQAVSAQLYGYKRLFEHRLDTQIDELWALQLLKNGKYRIYKALPSGQELFDTCFKLHNLLQGGKDSE
jgi:hypothetical protein